MLNTSYPFREHNADSLRDSSAFVGNPEPWVTITTCLMANFFGAGPRPWRLENRWAKVQSGRASANLGRWPHAPREGPSPNNTLLLDRLTPETLGKTDRAHEAPKILRAGARFLADQFSFDKWGVEIGKGSWQTHYSRAWNRAPDGKHTTHDRDLFFDQTQSIQRLPCIGK